MVLGEVKRTFNPEFINRIDEIIVFEALTDDDLRRIMALLVHQLNDNLVDRKLKITLTPEVVDWIIEVTCKDRSYGARPLRRAIQRYVEDPLSEELIRGHLRGGEVEVYLDAGALVVSAGRRARGRAELALAVSERWIEAQDKAESGRDSGRAGSAPKIHAFPLSPAASPAESGRRASRCRLKSSKVKSFERASTGSDRLEKRCMFKRLRVSVDRGARCCCQRRPRARSSPATPAAPAARAGSGQPRTICGQQVQPPRALPPDGSGPVVYLIAPCFEAQGNTSLVDIQTYLYYIQLKASRPSQGVWVPYNDETENSIRDDFKRLWATNFLDNLSIDVEDYTFSNGVIGKLVTYNMEERAAREDRRLRRLEEARDVEDRREAEGEQRADPARHLHRSRPDPQDRGHRPRHDEGEGLPVGGGHPRDQAGRGRSEAGARHLQHERRAEGEDRARSSSPATRRSPTASCAKHMKENRAQWSFSFITGRGTYQETKFEEDAERVMEYYRDHGYIRAQVGEPEVKVLNDSKDKKTR